MKVSFWATYMYCRPIRFSEKPVVYIKDKICSIKEHPLPYIPSLLLWILAVIALYADIKGAFSSSKEIEVIVLAVLLFLMGCVSVYMTTKVEKFRTRLNREKNAFDLLHTIAEEIRDYKTIKSVKEENNQNGTKSIYCPPKSEIIEKIKKICSDLLCKYIEPRHRRGITVTLKYRKGDSMESIRIGKLSGTRENASEKIEESHVYQLLNGQKLRFLYIKNVENFEKEELEILGNRHVNIRNRANQQNYKTFLALPIKTGNTNLDGTPVTRTSLGFLGFDSQDAYSFGNIPEQEIDFFASVVDSFSEIIMDLQRAR